VRAKLKRSVTALLPVSPTRRGSCNDCGECCKLPNRCPFLKFGEDGSSQCAIYKVRPLNCRKYPRTVEEFITPDVCGYYFEDELPMYDRHVSSTHSVAQRKSPSPYALLGRFARKVFS